MFFYLEDLGCSVWILMAMSSLSKSCCVYTVTCSEDPAVSLPVLQENGRRGEQTPVSMEKVFGSRVIPAMSQKPAEKRSWNILERVELLLLREATCHGGGGTWEATREKSVTRGRILSKRSGVFICFMSLCTWEVWEAWVSWGADLPDLWVGVSPQVLNIWWSLPGDKLWDINNLERNYCFHGKTQIFVFSTWTFFLFVSSTAVCVSRFLLQLL